MTTVTRSRRSVGERNDASLARAAEYAVDGLVPTFDRASQRFTVPSRSSHRTHMVTAKAVGGLVVVACDCARGVAPTHMAGLAACWHGAAVCAEMRTAGLVDLVDERWQIVPTSPAATATPPQPSPLYDRGPRCTGCGQTVDPYVDVPAARQMVTHPDGTVCHRGCE